MPAASENAIKAPPKDKLYLTDAELIRWMGVPEKVAREAFRELDRNPRSGFPRKQKLWGDRRYLPAIKAYLDRTGGLTMDLSDRSKVHG